MGIIKYFKKEGEIEAEAISILTGTIIGAGVLGIPFVVMQSGFLIGALEIILLGFAILTTNLFVGEVVLRTKGNHQLTGYAEKYLGKTGKKIMTVTMVFGTYGALLAYIIGEGESLFAIFQNLSPVIFSLIFFCVVSTIVFIGLKVIKRVEVLFSLTVLAIIIGISIVSITNMNINNLTTISLPNLFIPYGTILFAFAGAAAIPEMKEILIRKRKIMKKSILIGSLIPLIAYFLFAAFTIGVTGFNTTEIATIGLGRVLGQKMVLFGNLFAIFAMGTSFLTLGLALKEMFHYDYKLNKNLAWILTCIIPIVAFLLGIKSFIKTIGTTGAIAGGVEGTLLVLMFIASKKKGDRKPEYELKKHLSIAALLILVYIGGIIYTVYNLI